MLHIWILASENKIVLQLQRDGEIYNRNIGIQTTGGHLIITDLQKTDHGTYQCMASSDVANVRSDTLLTVVGKSG